MNLVCGFPLWSFEYMPIKCGLVSSALDGAELITSIEKLVNVFNVFVLRFYFTQL